MPKLPHRRREVTPPNFATVIGWKPGETPRAPAGFTASLFAGGLDNPRWLYVLPNGDVLVAESRTEKLGGEIPPPLLEGLKRAGCWEVGESDHAPARCRPRRTGRSPSDVCGESQHAIRHVARRRSPLCGQHRRSRAVPLQSGRPAGIWRRPKRFSTCPPAATTTTGPATSSPIPTARRFTCRSDHKPTWTKKARCQRATSGRDTRSEPRWIWDAGLRDGAAESERDGLGARHDDAVDRRQRARSARRRSRAGLLDHVRDGAFYGWPYSYFGQHEDPRHKGARPDMVAKAVAPDYALGPHTASLGLHFYRGRRFPEAWRGAFIGQHGSWNRSSLSGYKVIHVPFRNGRPSGMPQDFLTGFIASPTSVRGRPVGVAELPDGSLLVADDAGNSVWRVRRDDQKP